MKSFFSEAIKSIKTTGSIKPSSKYLVNKCLKGLNFSDADTIIEFGPGNGCFTEEILNSISKNTNLYSFEINSVFYNYCKSKFANNSNVKIVNESALDLGIFLNKKSIKKANFIISSLPFAIFNESQKKDLLNTIKSNLNKDGVFVQYQYSLGNYKELKNTFSKVDVSLVVRNLPPAFIYKCSI